MYRLRHCPQQCQPSKHPWSGTMPLDSTFAPRLNSRHHHPASAATTLPPYHLPSTHFCRHRHRLAQTPTTITVGSIGVRTAASCRIRWSHCPPSASSTTCSLLITFAEWPTIKIGARWRSKLVCTTNWTLLDALFDSAARANKSVILGLQAGVCAPRWLLEQDGVALVKFVHHNPGWFGWASWQSYIDGIPVITYARQWENPLYTAALERVVRALGARWRRPHAASAPPFHRSGTRSFPTRLCLNS